MLVVMEIVEGWVVFVCWEGVGVGFIFGVGSSVCVDCLWFVFGEGNVEGWE